MSNEFMLNSDSTSAITLISRPVKCYRYDPQPDITIYELARALPYMHIGLSFSGQEYIDQFLMNVGTAIRHFKEQS